MIANRFEEFSDSDPTIVYKYHNYKNVNLYGFHLNILFFPTDKTEFRSTYSFTDSNSDYDDIQDGISKHSLNLEFKYKLNDLSRIIFSTKYNSNKTIDVSLEDANNQRTEIILPQYYIVNLSYFKSFNSKNYIKFGVKNLFDYIDENPSAPDFLAALASPLVRNQSTADSKSPSVSVSAFLASIMPAPVAPRSSFTIEAVIAISALLIFRRSKH